MVKLFPTVWLWLHLFLIQYTDMTTAIEACARFGGHHMELCCGIVVCLMAYYGSYQGFFDSGHHMELSWPFSIHSRVPAPRIKILHSSKKNSGGPGRRGMPRFVDANRFPNSHLIPYALDAGCYVSCREAQYYCFTPSSCRLRSLKGNWTTRMTRYLACPRSMPAIWRTWVSSFARCGRATRCRWRSTKPWWTSRSSWTTRLPLTVPSFRRRRAGERPLVVLGGRL